MVDVWQPTPLGVAVWRQVVRAELIEGVNREVTAAELAAKLAAEGGLTLLHPFEDPASLCRPG